VQCRRTGPLKWQSDWDSSNKGDLIFFPKVKDKTKDCNSVFAFINDSYRSQEIDGILHIFKILDDPIFPCKMNL
jgi:hypothetical protein